MKKKFAILIALGLFFAVATQAQGLGDRRDIRHDRMEIRHDRHDGRHDRRDIRKDHRHIRHDRRERHQGHKHF